MIRIAEQSDYIDMDSVFRASAKALCVRDYDLKTILAWVGEARPERFIRSVNDGCTLYVKVLEDKIACFGELNIERQLLLSLFVSPDYAGQGIGKEMIEFLFTKARDAGIKVLKVDSSLNAANFYLRNGFVEQSKSDFTTQNGVVLKSIKMECVLTT
ncbi:GNAT family N-acetyltransferase [Colwellia piezophila]|uniref:GNAT family N-acetyltransferase n=1 Tax=Colwellia piezophila TaxID=211668 RepID=UPI0003703CA5|nr:GNAT family N-acetyltransferase [Colwellia piezophila]